ncbi:hypothetical protein L3Q82_004873 [Scortum barcoo]|uniref:Uncharacterized protein n=1 Tax=Scortum barcoo TaxID=214431 RepID=A0ACB8VDQ9_9TELE|nr:hypothetical protein L3Q82_004873 [Scortum barcoo]
MLLDKVTAHQYLYNVLSDLCCSEAIDDRVETAREQQIFLVYSYGSVEFLNLAIMSYDRTVYWNLSRTVEATDKHAVLYIYYQASGTAVTERITNSEVRPQLSHDDSQVCPSCEKAARAHQDVPKKSRPSDPADYYRPVALTSHVMKVLERLVLAQLRPQKFSDDSAVVGCMREGEEGEYRTLIDNFVEWSRTESPEAECQQDQRDGDRLQEEEDAFTATTDQGGRWWNEVEDYKYLGVVMIDNRLDWKSNHGGCVQEGDEQTLFPEEEAEILQRGQQDSSFFIGGGEPTPSAHLVALKDEVWPILGVKSKSGPCSTPCLSDPWVLVKNKKFQAFLGPLLVYFMYCGDSAVGWCWSAAWTLALPTDFSKGVNVDALPDLLTAAGRKDLRYLSFTQRGWSSRSLKELPRAVRVSCM